MRFAALALCLWLLRPLQAGEAWICARTPHFELYTSCSAKQAVQALAVFEQVRLFFLQNGGSRNIPEAPVQVIAFSSEAEFAPYRVNRNSIAYYQESRGRDSIVLQDLNPEHRQAAVHEYAHLVVHHAGGDLPLWLSEGLACLYSSLEMKSGMASIGRPTPAYLNVLAHQQWLRLFTLFGAVSNSPLNNDREQANVFYAQSWALTHLLSMSPEYGPAFPKFLQSIRSGATTTESLNAVYGKTPDQLKADLVDYLEQNRLGTWTFKMKSSPADTPARVENFSSLNRDLVLADLLCSHQTTAWEGEKQLQKIAAPLSQAEHNPRSAFPVFYALAYCHYQLHNWQQARFWGQKAITSAHSTGEFEQINNLLRDLALLDLAKAQHSDSASL